MDIDPVTVVNDLLLERGAMDDASLLAAANAAGAGLSEDELDALLHDDEEIPLLVCLPGGRHGVAGHLLAGRTFTHRLTEAETALDVLEASPDLLMLAPLLDVECDLLARPDGDIEWAEDADEERCDAIEEAGFDIDTVITLPGGTLAGVRPGEIVGLTLTREGALVRPVEPGPIPGGLAERIRVLITKYHVAEPAEEGDGDRFVDDEPAMPVPIADLVAALCDDDASLFTAPLPPFGDLLAAFGFVTVDGDVAASEADADRWRATKSAASMVARYQLSPVSALSVAAISDLVSTVTDGIADDVDADPEDLAAQILPEIVRDRDTVARMAGALADPDAARALLEEALGFDRAPAFVLEALAGAWEPLAPRDARVALRWLRARSVERMGLAREAEDILESARTLSATWPPVLEDLARYASDRGQSERAISLLRQAGAPDDDEDLAFLQGLASPARSGLGRNQPCWCGSGRKYKVCHLGKEDLPLDARAGWLYRKLTTFAGEGPYRPLILDLAMRRSVHDAQEGALVRAFHDPLVMDAVLFEGGAAAAFLSERGHLLPDDEASMLQQWLLNGRSLFEVEDVRPGRGFRVRDMRTGDRHDVSERSGSRQAKPGMRLLMRLAPVGEAWQIFGGIETIPMPFEQRALDMCDALDAGEAGPGELMSFLTSRFAPPELRTTSGEPMVMCTAHYRVGDVPGVTAELDRLFEDGGPGSWSRTTGDGEFPTVLGTVELGGDELTLSAMSEGRFDALQAELEAVTGLTLVDVQRVPTSELLRQAGSAAGHGESSGAQSADGPAGGRSDAGRDLVDSPEMRDVMEIFARDYEARWLDMPIPALGGSTPREAADDPTRRDDLIRLLDSFDGMPGGPGTMRPDRLRAALGL